MLTPEGVRERAGSWPIGWRIWSCKLLLDDVAEATAACQSCQGHRGRDTARYAAIIQFFGSLTYTSPVIQEVSHEPDPGHVRCLRRHASHCSTDHGTSLL